MEPYLGQICMFGFDFVPAGWARCDGITTFALPNLPAPTEGAHPKTFNAINGIFPQRSGFASESPPCAPAFGDDD